MLAPERKGFGVSVKRLSRTISMDQQQSNLPIERVFPDGGYGYIVIFLSFLLYMIADGIAYSLGLLNSVWLEYFKQGETKTSWIGSIFYAMPLLSGPVMAQFVEKYGCKRMTAVGGAISCFGFILSSLCNSVEELYITIGAVGGLGLSAAYIVGLVSVERWFKAHRSLAIGIVSAGTGLGTFILPPITQIFLNAFDWKLTIIGLSGFLMLMPIIAVFMDDPPWKIKEIATKRQRKLDYTSIKTSSEEQNQEKCSNKCGNFSLDFSHFRDRNFFLLSLSSFAIYTLYNTAFYFLPELLKDSELESASFIACIGFFLMLGMVSLGWAADQQHINIIYLNFACVFVCGLTEALIPLFASNSLLLSVCCSIFGFTFASAYVLIPRIVELIVGVEKFTSALGLNFFMQGLGLLIGTPFASQIYSISESWPFSFYICGGLLSLSSILASSIRISSNSPIHSV